MSESTQPSAQNRRPAGARPAAAATPGPGPQAPAAGTVGTGTARHGACPRGGTIPTVRAPLAPIYTPHSVRPVYDLHYDWTGQFDPAATDLGAVERCADDAVAACRPLWAGDGLTLETWRVAGDRMQVLFAATPEISPAFCVQRAKGRLDRALRQFRVPVRFRRNVAFRSLGENTRSVVANYIGRQASKSDYADSRYKDYLTRFTHADAKVMLETPYAGAHGRYWCNLHVVLVVQDRRFPMTRPETLTKARDTCFAVAAKKGHALASLSVMPDHIHMALRGNIEHAPMEVGLGFLNNLAYVLGYNHCWSEEFYTGTFSEYDLDAIPG